MRTAAFATAILAIIVAGCGGPVTGPPTSPAPSSTPAASFPTISDETQAWCVLHLGGPTDDRHQVEDAAIALGLVEGAKTRQDVFDHWGGLSPQDLRLSVRTYVLSCQAAFDKSSAPPG
jgi:hypothetical protein